MGKTSDVKVQLLLLATLFSATMAGFYIPEGEYAMSAITASFVCFGVLFRMQFSPTLNPFYHLLQFLCAAGVGAGLGLAFILS